MSTFFLMGRGLCYVLFQSFKGLKIKNLDIVYSDVVEGKTFIFMCFCSWDDDKMVMMASSPLWKVIITITKNYLSSFVRKRGCMGVCFPSFYFLCFFLLFYVSSLLSPLLPFLSRGSAVASVGVLFSYFLFTLRRRR